MGRVNDEPKGWHAVLVILGTLLAGWLSYFVVLFVVMFAIVWLLTR